MFDMTETDSTFSTLTYFAGPSSVYAYDLSYQVYIVDQHGELHPCSHGYLDHDYRDDRLVFTLGDVLYSFDQLGVLCRRGSTGRWRPMAVYHRLEDVPQAHVNIGLALSYQPDPVTCEETPVTFTTPIVSPSSMIEDTIDPSQLLRQMSAHTDISSDSPLTSPEPESDLDSLSADDSSPDLLKGTLNTRLLFTPPDARPTEAARAFWKSLRSDGSAMTKCRIDEFVDAVVSENRGSRKRTRSYSCIMCSAIQRRPSAYKIHLYSHFKFKVAQCNDCLQWFSTPSNRDRHHCKFKTTSYTWCSDA